jgi:hypothetical protein
MPDDAMPDDALERIKKRLNHRPTVPSREETLLDIENSRKLDKEVPSSPDLVNTVKEATTKQSTLRLEKEIYDRVSELCRKENLCREVFFEALFVQFEANRGLQSVVMSEAAERQRKRSKAANKKRAKTMLSGLED